MDFLTTKSSTQNQIIVILGELNLMKQDLVGEDDLTQSHMFHWFLWWTDVSIGSRPQINSNNTTPKLKTSLLSINRFFAKYLGRTNLISSNHGYVQRKLEFGVDTLTIQDIWCS
jgi:hypothetical protein